MAISAALGPEVFVQIANETGGHYFRISTAETQAAANILLNEMVTTSDLTIHTDQVYSGSPETYSISIDSTMTDANFLLNVFSGSVSLALIDPNGMPVNSSDPDVTYTAISNAKYYQIANPAIGEWQAQVSGSGTFAFSASGNSSISFEYLSDTSLAKDAAVNLQASLAGPVASAFFEFTYPDGTLLETVNLFDDGLHEDDLADDGVFGGAYTPTTAGNFYFHVEGTTTDGTGFERTATEMIRVQTLSVVAPADQSVSAGASQVYDFLITNGGTVDETYDFAITSSQGWADLSSVPSSAVVLAGATEHILIPVNVPLTAVEGSMDELVLTAVSQLNPLVNDSDSVQTTVSAPPSDLIFSDGFESGDFSAWYWAETDGGDLSITAQAAAVGSLGVQAVIDDSAEIVLYDHTPNDEKHFSARFYFNPNSMDIPYNPTPNQQGFYLFSGSDNTSWVLCLYVEQQGEYYTLALCGSDDTGWMQSGPVLIADEWQALEVEWQAATSAGANDGQLKLWINDTLVKSIENLDNDTRSITKTTLGIIDPGNSVRGTAYFDAFETHQGSHIGLDPNGPALSPPPQPGDLVFADDFESGDLSAWVSAVTDGGDLSVSAASAYQGSYGLQALIDDKINLRVVDSSPLDETHYRARFHFNPNSLTMSSGKAHYIFDGIDLATGDAIMRMELIYENGQYKLRVQVMKDNYVYLNSSKYPISNGWHAVEVEWMASSGPGANDGFLAFWIDGVVMETISSVDNDILTIGEIRLGATNGIDNGTAGSMFFDNFESRRDSYIGP